MPGQVKFTPWGIPYLVEFANVSIRSPASTRALKAKAASQQRPPLPPKCPTCGTHGPSAPNNVGAAVSAWESRVDEPQRQGGLYIQLPRRHTNVPDAGEKNTKISAHELHRLRYKIAAAVTQAGMSTPPTDETDALQPQQRRDPEKKTPYVTPPSVYKGTYGQVKGALRDAGLTTTPCDETGFQNATRLGTMFVCSPTADGGVVFNKLTLWG